MAKVEMIVKSLKKDEMKLFHDMSTRVKSLEVRWLFPTRFRNE